MRNVTFNKKLFFNKKDKLTTIPVKEVVSIIEILHKSSKIVAVEEAIKLPSTKEEDLLLKISTKRQLRGEALEET